MKELLLQHHVHKVHPLVLLLFAIMVLLNQSWGGPSKSAMIGGVGINNAGEPPFEIRGFSLGNVVIAAGLLITVLSFVEYLSDSGSEGLHSKD